MPALPDTQPGGGEARLTDALHEVIVYGGRVLAVPLPAGRRRHDIGSPESYCAAFLEYALRDRRFGGSHRARAAQLLDG
jgi:UTP-glucose-1-phosphate uridylyltransferase